MARSEKGGKRKASGSKLKDLKAKRASRPSQVKGGRMANDTCKETSDTGMMGCSG